MNIAIYIPVEELQPFEGHPYKVLDNEEMSELVESIREHGVLTPLIVRPLDEKETKFEVISGHRRLHAAIRAGVKTVPAHINYDIDRDAASILVVDSNLHREHILPSEKAFAYKMKMDAMKHQGKRTTSSQIATKSDTAAQIGAASNESRDQVYRYIRLTNLIPALLDKVDEGQIAFSVGVELSYLHKAAQEHIAELIKKDERTPSYSQAVRMHQYFTKMGMVPNEQIDAIMAEEKPNQREQIKLRRDKLSQYFPESYTDRQIMEDILAGLELLKRKRQRERNRDAR